MEGNPVVLKPSQTAYLSELVDDVVRLSRPSALKKHHHIVNEVPKMLQVKADKTIVYDLIAGLLQSVMNYSVNSLIRISAKAYSDIMIVHVRDFNATGFVDGIYQLQHLDPLVKKLRGFLGLTSHRMDERTVALSFLNLPWSIFGITH